MLCALRNTPLAPLRRDEQVTRSMTGILEWCVCPNCKHVSLGDWTIHRLDPSIDVWEEQSGDFDFPRG